MKKRLLGILFCLFILKSGFSQVTINEYCCSNLATTLDNYNEYNDWVELYNANAFNISISGYYLSDNVQEPLKWKIPSGVSIGANGYLLIWADGRNEYTNSNLHSSFKLTQSKKNPDWIFHF
ncbi:MAG: lamin tail domain-containing protein [Bacteroidetes bacterium]|nr:lamin tail domain-containing protein [Bacteroidota bacterium]